jgi:hypothetical protein
LESPLNSASNDVKFNMVSKEKLFDGPEVLYRCPMNREK